MLLPSDGFTGNVVLKTMEGLGSAVLEIIRSAVKGSGFFKFGALLMKPALTEVKRKMDASEYGGALLLGVRAPFIICHSSSKAKAIKNAVRVAIELTEKDIVGKIGRNPPGRRKWGIITYVRNQCGFFGDGFLCPEKNHDKL